MTGRSTNWAGNVTFSAQRLHRPSSLDELRQLVARSRRARALGTGHSFSRIADTTGDLISVAGLPRTIDVIGSKVTVGAGVRYGELASRLQAHGLALHNLGSLPHISVAGACATGTHGSGVTNGNLATAVSALELVTAQGDLVTLSRDDDGERFAGAVVGLGCLGVVTHLTLDVEPSFEVQQHVYEDLPRDQLDEQFEAIMASDYSVSLFTGWKGSSIDQVWRKRRIGPGGATSDAAWEPRWMGARLADGPRNPIPAMSPEQCTEQLGVPGPWHERLPHFRMDFTPSAGDELQSEYLLPRRHAREALATLDDIRDHIAAVLQIAEIRTVTGDDLWLSPSHQRDTVAIHFTWVSKTLAVSPVLTLIEERLAPLEARPHWGKLFTISPEVVAGLYDRLPDFQQLRDELDPTRKFSNALVDRYIG